MDKSYENKKSNKDCICTICGWFFQIALWGMIAFVIFIYFTSYQYESSEKFKIYIYVLIVIYIIYFCLEINSPTSKYLCNKKDKKGIKEKMSQFFNTHPVITFTINGYHWETVHYTETDEDGNEVDKTREEKVYTH